MKVPLVSLAPWDPFQNVVWRGLDEPLTRKEVEAALGAKLLRKHYLRASRPYSRSIHARRVAHLVVFGWKTPIELEFGVVHPSDSWWPVIDGNHRHAAAVFRGDGTIEALISGDEDLAAEVLQISIDDIVAENDRLYGVSG